MLLSASRKREVLETPPHTAISLKWFLCMHICQPCCLFHLRLAFLTCSLLSLWDTEKAFFSPSSTALSWSRCCHRIYCTEIHLLSLSAGVTFLFSNFMGKFTKARMLQKPCGRKYAKQRESHGVPSLCPRGRFRKLGLRLCPSPQQQMQHVGGAWFTSFHHC